MGLIIREEERDVRRKDWELEIGNFWVNAKEEACQRYQAWLIGLKEKRKVLMKVG